MENLFNRLKDVKLKSMNLMQRELCESPRCEECKKYYYKCTFKERENEIQELFENLEERLKILIKGDDIEI
jgi:hypothetical protein